MVKKLIIAPHVDDEVLGCGGILDKSCFVYYCGIDESEVPPDPGHRIPIPEREEELKKAARFFGFNYKVNRNSKVLYFTVQEFIDEIQSVINAQKPEMVFIPHPGYNQDHQTVFNACQVALRPHDKNFFVKKILVYEAIHDFLWSIKKFNPTYFVKIDIKRKNDGYALHKSQVRVYRSFELIETLAHLRGAMANVDYAEAFEILRWVE